MSEPDEEGWLAEWHLSKAIYDAWRWWRMFRLLACTAAAMMLAAIVLIFFGKEATYMWAWAAVYTVLAAVIGPRVWKTRPLRKVKK